MRWSSETKAWALSALIAIVALGAIYTASANAPVEAVEQAVPQLALETIPHLNAAAVATALVTVTTGFRAVRRGQTTTHARAMAATAALFTAFLVMYLVKLAATGVTEYPGSDFVYRYVYLPVLVVHMSLAAVSIPLVSFCLLSAVLLPEDEIPASSHPRVGRIAAPLWAVSFTLGIVVYLMLHAPL